MSKAIYTILFPKILKWGKKCSKSFSRWSLIKFWQVCLNSVNFWVIWSKFNVIIFPGSFVWYLLQFQCANNEIYNDTICSCGLVVCICAEATLFCRWLASWISFQIWQRDIGWKFVCAKWAHSAAESKMRLYYAVRRKSIPNQCFA